MHTLSMLASCPLVGHRTTTVVVWFMPCRVGSGILRGCMPHARVQMAGLRATMALIRGACIGMPRHTGLGLLARCVQGVHPKGRFDRPQGWKEQCRLTTIIVLVTLSSPLPAVAFVQAWPPPLLVCISVCISCKLCRPTLVFALLSMLIVPPLARVFIVVAGTVGWPRCVGLRPFAGPWGWNRR